MEVLEDWEIIYDESIKKEPPRIPVKILFYSKKKLTPLKKEYIPDRSLSEFRKDYKKLISHFYD
jgi:hypothetical protein